MSQWWVTNWSGNFKLKYFVAPPWLLFKSFQQSSKGLWQISLRRICRLLVISRKSGNETEADEFPCVKRKLFDNRHVVKQVVHPPPSHPLSKKIRKKQEKLLSLFDYCYTLNEASRGCKSSFTTTDFSASSSEIAFWGKIKPKQWSAKFPWPLYIICWERMLTL